MKKGPAPLDQLPADTADAVDALPPGDRPEKRAIALARVTEIADAEVRLGDLRSAEARHYNWIMLGLSPFSLLLLVAGIFGGTEVFFVAMLAVLMVVVEGVRWRRVSGDVAALESRLAELAEEDSPTGRDGIFPAPEAS